MAHDQDPSPNAGAANQKAIDDWLPITSSRNAKWWYAAFHNVTAMVGAGVLSLPYAMSELGWYSLSLHRYHDKDTLFSILLLVLDTTHFIFSIVCTPDLKRFSVVGYR